MKQIFLADACKFNFKDLKKIIISPKAKYKLEIFVEIFLRVHLPKLAVVE